MSTAGLVRRWALLLVVVLLAGGAVLLAPAQAASGSPASDPPGPSAPGGPSVAVPVYAYFYQWFTESSWNRAKDDHPLIGRYSSDDPQVLRTQLQQMRSAGITGVLTSWKDTEPLDRRLQLLITAASAEQLDLGVVYEALDFQRDPLPIATVEHDLRFLVANFGDALRSRYFGRPVIVWTGTDQYSLADVQAVRQMLGDNAYLLAASRSVAGYQRVASVVDGEAYYWSSADPMSPGTLVKLQAMSDAVHTNHGIWIAPAAAGYDGRTLGGTRVIDRDGGQTLVRSLDNAFASAPDAVGVISWNEWSENTYIEPGERYGDRELATLRDYLQQRARGAPQTALPGSSSEGGPSVSWNGATAAVTLGLITVGAIVVLRLAGPGRRDARQRRHSLP